MCSYTTSRLVCLFFSTLLLTSLVPSLHKAPCELKTEANFHYHDYTSLTGQKLSVTFDIVKLHGGLLYTTVLNRGVDEYWPLKQ
jgi:hypothetical protein